MSKDKKDKKNSVKAAADSENSTQKVKMKFKEDKFYNDPNKALYEKDKIYTVEGGDMIARWLKRGGEIVEGELEMPSDEPNPSGVVANEEASGEDADNTEEQGE